MKKQLVTLILLAPILIAHAWADSVVHLRDAEHLEFAPATRKTLNPQQIAVEKINESRDKHGRKHTRYRQYLNGIPVWGKHIISHENDEGFTFKRHRKLTGDLVRSLNANLAATPRRDFNKEDALSFAKQAFIRGQPNQTWTFEREKSRLVYYIDHKHQIHLAYAIHFMAIPDHGDPAKPHVILDANTKALLKRWNGLKMETIAGRGPGGNSKAVSLGGTGYYEYGSSPLHNYLEITKVGSHCELENAYVKTLTLKHKTWGGTPVRFRCNRHAGDHINGAASPENDAHYFATEVSKMYQAWYGITPLKGKITVRVHYDDNYPNAFWDGKQINFGDGNERYYPFTALSIVAHEIAHGVTERYSRLQYYGESGGIDEAFSDMAAIAAQYHLRGKVTWAIGGEILKAAGRATRSMKDPAKDGRSFDNAKNYVALEETFQNLDADESEEQERLEYRLDPHFASGVFNKAFYHLATTPGWDPHKAFDVMLNANQHYWGPTTGFAEAAWGAVKSADELGYSTEDVVQAFKKVGIDCTLDGCDI